MKKNMKRPRHLLTLLAVVVAFVAGYLFCSAITRITPEVAEANQLMLLRRQVLQYKERHGQLPETLAEVEPESEGRYFCGKFGVDRRGDPVQYVRDGDEGFTLKINGYFHQDYRGMVDEKSVRWPCPASEHGDTLL